MDGIYNIFTYVMLFVVGIFTGRLAAKNVVYGVTIPEEYLDSNDLGIIKRLYLRIYLSTMIPVLLLMIGLEMFAQTTEVMTIGFVIVWVLITTVAFIVCYKKVSAFKAGLPLEQKSKKHMVSASLDHDNKTTQSIYMYFIPSLIATISIGVFTSFKYDELPISIPIQYDLSGHIIRYADKGFGSVYGLVLMMVFMMGLFYVLTYVTLKYSSRHINPKQPETSYIRITKANKYFALVMGIISFMVIIMFSILQLAIINIYELTETLNLLLLIVPVSGIMITLLLFFLNVGIQGDRLKIDSNEVVKEDVADIDRDKGWYLGMFYANPRDRSVFVPKRLGGGFTINFGNPLALFMLFVIALIIIIVNILN